MASQRFLGNPGNPWFTAHRNDGEDDDPPQDVKKYGVRICWLETNMNDEDIQDLPTEMEM